MATHKEKARVRPASVSTDAPEPDDARRKVRAKRGKSSRRSRAATRHPSAAPVPADAGAWSDRNPELRRRFLAAEKDLAAALERSDRSAAKAARRALEDVGREFVELNRGLAVSLAARFNRQVHDNEDNVAAATMGLWNAFRRFDPDRGVAFSTFSRNYINGAVQREVRRKEFQHISQDDFNLRRQVRLAQNELASVLGRSPTLAEIAASTGLPLERVEKVLSPPVASLDAPAGDGDDSGFTLGDRLAAAVDVSSDGDEDVLEPYLDMVDDLELWILLQRGGFVGAESVSLLEVSDGVGVGREIVRRSESRARVRIASTVLADRLGRLAEPDEVAALMGVEVGHVVAYSGSSWELLATRYRRLRARLAALVEGPRRGFGAGESALLQGRLDRCGEEFMVEAGSLIRDAAGRCLDAGGSPVGVRTATRAVWAAFTGWDYRSVAFPAHLNEALLRSFDRQRKLAAFELPSPDELWAMVVDLR